MPPPTILGDSNPQRCQPNSTQKNSTQRVFQNKSIFLCHPICETSVHNIISEQFLLVDFQTQSVNSFSHFFISREEGVLECLRCFLYVNEKIIITLTYPIIFWPYPQAFGSCLFHPDHVTEISIARFPKKTPAVKNGVFATAASRGKSFDKVAEFSQVVSVDRKQGLMGVQDHFLVEVNRVMQTCVGAGFQTPNAFMYFCCCLRTYIATKSTQGTFCHKDTYTRNSRRRHHRTKGPRIIKCLDDTCILEAQTRKLRQQQKINSRCKYQFGQQNIFQCKQVCSMFVQYKSR